MTIAEQNIDLILIPILSQVSDPEIPVLSIMDMGVVRSAVIENDIVKIDFIEQALVYGDNKPYLVALLVLKKEKKEITNENIIHKIEIINKNLSKIEKIKKFLIIEDQFTIENGLMTPTLKLKRYKIIQKYKNQVEDLY